MVRFESPRKTQLTEVLRDGSTKCNLISWECHGHVWKYNGIYTVIANNKYMSNVHNPSWLIISLEYTNVAI